MKAMIVLAARSAWARRFTLALTIIAVSLSTVLLLATERLRHDIRKSFSQALSGTDLIVGARGSPTQILLHTVFHLGPPTQAVTLKRIEAIGELPQVAWVVPIALGDTFRGFPVIATDERFLRHVKVGDRQPLMLAQGREYGRHAEAVIGAQVARQLGLGAGAGVTLSHGSGPLAEGSHDDQPFTITGVLAPSGSPVDRAVLISLESMHALHAGWVAGVRPARGSQPSTDPGARPVTVSAALVGLRARSTVFSVQRRLQAEPGEPLTAVLPGVTLDELWRALGVGENALRLMGALVALASLAGLVSVILAGLDARRRELAILRSVGASQQALVILLITEGTLACLSGMTLGVTAAALLTVFAASPLQAQFGIALGTDFLRAGEWLLLAAVLATGILASLLPALRAWRLSLADGLSPRS
jgi:putative ABC transport system permease protein